MSSTIHAGWLRLTKFPLHVIPCPRCSAPQSHKAHNWRWDEEAEQWLCQRPSCQEKRVVQRVCAAQRMYPPVNKGE